MLKKCILGAAALAAAGAVQAQGLVTTQKLSAALSAALSRGLGQGSAPNVDEPSLRSAAARYS